ncbi:MULTISPECIES: hypothetical protein [Haloarcula]|uniref:hypothetical protein n=1 Tax=Haloarcula TaxID=2237 RepID=UPI0023EDF33F|nr:hypothetical protein [Halomicroarcula sp. XH51]
MGERVEVEEAVYTVLAERAGQKDMPTGEYINQLLSEIAEKVKPIVQRERVEIDSEPDIEERLRDLGYL